MTTPRWWRFPTHQPDPGIDPARWYPAGAIGRMMTVLAGTLPGSLEESLSRLGGATVHILRQSGMYQQLDFEPGLVEDADLVQLRSVGRLIASMWPAMYDFGRTRVESDAGGQSILIHFEALGDCHPAILSTIEGFTAEVTSLVSAGSMRAICEQDGCGHLVARIGRA
jgi:hypothetical protein